MPPQQVPLAEDLVLSDPCKLTTHTPGPAGRFLRSLLRADRQVRSQAWAASPALGPGSLLMAGSPWLGSRPGPTRVLLGPSLSTHGHGSENRSFLCLVCHRLVPPGTQSFKMGKEKTWDISLKEGKSLHPFGCK